MKEVEKRGSVSSDIGSASSGLGSRVIVQSPDRLSSSGS